MVFEGYNLNLEGKEPSAEEVLAEIRRQSQEGPVGQIVFCGYGEPTMRLDAVLAIGRALKQAQAQGKYPAFKIRLNTNGLGNLINHCDIVPQLRSAVDVVYVSLNAQNEELWRKLLRPAPGYENGFASVLEFLKGCAGAGFDRVAASCVDNTGADPAAVRALAASCGADFNEREYLNEQ